MSEAQADLREIQHLGAATREHVVLAQPGSPLRERRFLHAGLSVADADYRFVRPRPRHASVVACFAGSGRVLLDGEWRRMGPGQAYVMPAKSLHAYGAAGRGWTIGWATYGRGPGTLALAAETPPRLVPFEPEPLRASLLGLVREDRGAADPGIMRHWAELVHLHLERLVSGRMRDRRLDELWSAVAADLARPWTLSDLARPLGVGAERLRQLSIGATGRSPGRQLLHLRMVRAAHLLRTTDRPVSEIGAEIGYHDPFAFSAAFRRWAGTGPRAFRQDGQ